MSTKRPNPFFSNLRLDEKQATTITTIVSGYISLYISINDFDNFNVAAQGIVYEINKFRGVPKPGNIGDTKKYSPVNVESLETALKSMSVRDFIFPEDKKKS